MVNKYPALISFVTGIMGTIDPNSIVERSGDNKKLVTFKYWATNSLIKRNYPYPIPYDNIIHYNNHNNVHAGVEPHLVFITGDAHGKAPIFDKVFGENGSILIDAQKLRKENENLKIRISMLENKVRELGKDTKKQIATAHEINKISGDKEALYNRYNNMGKHLPPNPPVFSGME